MERVERNDAEKKALKMMIDVGVNQKMLAKYLDITPQAINNRLKRGKIAPLIEAIQELDEKLPGNTA